MFLIIYEKQIITLEKKYKINSMWKKNEAQISGFAVTK